MNDTNGMSWTDDSCEAWRVRYHKEICHGLAQALSNEEFTDIKIIIDDKTFNCHRIVLSIMSPYFSAMFASGMKECQDGVVHLQNVESEAFEKILKFIYGGQDFIDTENVDSLLQAAVMLQIKCLQERCEEYMVGKLDPENSLGAWKLAQGHGCLCLAERAFQFILYYFEQICKTEDFLAIDCDELLQIIDNNNLNIKSEELVCEAVMKWVHFNVDTRIKDLPRIFEKLRLPLIQPEYLIDVLEQDKLIRHDQSCRDVLEEAKRYHLLPARRQEFVSPRMSFRNFGDFEEVVVCVGGTDDNSKTTQRVICYSEKRSKWFSLAPMPHDPGVEFATCSYGNAIYISGGSTKMNAMLCYISTQNKWVYCEPMLLGRRRHAMVAVGEHVYVLGGYDDNNDNDFRTLMSIERYSIATGSWEDAGYLSVAVRSASVAVDREKIYLFGGVTREDFDTKIVQCFDTRLKTCNIVCELPVYCRLSSAISHDHKIYLVCPDGDVIVFSADGTTEEKGKIPGFDRYSFGAVLKNNSIIVLGGMDSDHSYGDCITFDLLTSTSSISADVLPQKASGIGCVKTVINKKYLETLSRSKQN
ncbi:kelch-like protein 24 [Mytilus trossulus]|uniref:kelch-like protein 24 n=1 Tax=Mytilus trossulus TaxID=6551 RepID=UPI0030064955